MSTTSDDTEIPQYQLIAGSGPKLVPIQSIPKPPPVTLLHPKIETEPLPEDIVNVYILLDSQKGKSDSSPHTPDFLTLNNLKNRNVKSLSANSSTINVITGTNELLTASTIISEDRNPDISFQHTNSFDLMEIMQTNCGIEHTIALAQQNDQSIVLACGNNTYGQIGIPSLSGTTRFRPVSFPSPQHFVQVSCGAFYTILLTDVSDIWVFGYNSHGQLGLGNDTKIINSPRLNTYVDGLPICSVACGSSHTLLLTSTGSVYGAGNNHENQLNLSSPIDFFEFTFLNFLSSVFIVFITAKGNSSAAIDECGSLYLWGGDFSFDNRSISLPHEERFVDVALGNDGRVAALTSWAKLYVFGYYTIEGKQVNSPVEIEHPVGPFFRVFSGGDFFAVLAGASSTRTPPLKPMAYDRSLPQPSTPCLPEKLRQPTRNLFLDPTNYNVLMSHEASSQIIRAVFSRLSTINGSFVHPCICEGLCDVQSGVDVTAAIRLFDFLEERRPNCLLTVVQAFSRTLLGVLESPPRIRRPPLFRFLIVGLLVPSCNRFREGYNFWCNLVLTIRKLEVSSVLSQWLSDLDSSTLLRILKSLSSFLGQIVINGKLYQDTAQATVGALECVWKASNRSRKLQLDSFYDRILNKMIDINTEYKLYASQTEWCYTRDAPWLLSADTKTRFARLHARMIMNQQQYAAMARATEFWGITPIVKPEDLFLIIEVRRDHLITDAFAAITNLKNPEAELKKPLKIIFKDEPGVDEGGLQREFFQLAIEQLFDPSNGFFTRSGANGGDINWFNKDATDPTSLQAFMLTGVLFGLAIYNGVILNVRFPIALYKKLRGLNVGFNDLKELDPQVYSTLENILTYPGNVEEDMGLTYDYAGVPLKENGLETMVTNANREQYVNDVANYLINGSVEEQFEKFKFGWMLAVGSLIMTLFRPEELELLITGTEELDFIALESVTRYEGYTQESPAVRIFWKIVQTRMTDDEKRRLLYFVTSSPRAPINGLASVPFIIAKDADPTHIPTSHTCFFMLVLPDIEDEEIMYKKLRIAIENEEGFQFK